MRTLNNAELAFLAMLGHPELTTKVLRVYAAKSYLFTEMFHPHLNLMWNTYVDLLRKHRQEYGLSLRRDITAAGLAEAVASSGVLPDELKQKCDDLLQKLVAGDIPDLAQGEQLVKNLMMLEANRRLVGQLNTNPDLAELQQSLDASRRTMSLMDDAPEDSDEACVVVRPLRDIRRLARKSVRIPTGINFMDELSAGGGRAGDMWLILGAPASGKCLAPETLVLRQDGYAVRADSLKPGDRLLGPDSQPRTVLSTVSGTGPMYRVSYTHGTPFLCNGEHLLTVTSPAYKRLTLNGRILEPGELAEISVDEYLKLSAFKRSFLRMVRTGAAFSSSQLQFPIDPYFAGLFAGSPSMCMGFICSTDEGIIEDCIEYARTMGWTYRRGSMTDNTVRLALSAPTRRESPRALLRRWMMRDGLMYVPPQILHGSEQVRRSFLAGFMDACGINLQDRVYIGTSTNPGLLEGVQFVARSLGLAAVLSSLKVKEGRKPSWQLRLTGMLHRIPARHTVFRPPSGRQRRKLTDAFPFTVEPAGEGPYSGFMLDGDGRFLLSDFTVAHNSTLTVQMCCAQAILGNDVMWATYEQSVEGDLAERMIANITDTSLDSIRDVGFDDLDKTIQDRFWSATAGVDDHMVAMDMTRIRPDPQDPEDYGGAASIWKQFRKQKADGMNPKIVIIDWFGAMMTRIAANLGLDLAACYRFKAQEEINTLIRFAREEHVQIMVMHQLDVKAAAGRPTYLADATHAQDMHNMQNFFDLVIILGNRDVNSIMYMSNPKARKGGRVVRTVRMIGEKSRMVMEDGWLPNKDGNFYRPGASGGAMESGTASDYERELM